MSSRSRDLPDDEIRLLVMSHIASGRLPAVIVSSALAGYGAGEKCDVCDRPIELAETEYEVETAFSLRALRFHLRCHDIWQRECLEREGRIGPSAARPASLRLVR